jgi:putative SOS response-associated peptidase YedK
MGTGAFMGQGFVEASKGAAMINARSETAASKPAIDDALKFRRWLIPADGFYEWQRIGNASSLIVLTSIEVSCSRSGFPIALRNDPSGSALETCTF